MNKFKLEEISMKVQSLEELMLGIGDAIFNGSFDVSNYEMGFHHLVSFAKEISNELNEIVKGEFKNGK